MGSFVQRSGARRLALRSALVTSALGVLACSADDRRESLAIGSQSSKVIGGAVVGDCAWPSTVQVLAGPNCSGTLIHPRIVTTAAHCLPWWGTATIWFGGGVNSPTSFSVEAQCHAGANGEDGVNTANDWAYCVLPDDPRIRALPITPPLVGCEAQRYLQPGASAWVVGFGSTSPEGDGMGTKREVAVTINALDRRAPGTIDVGDATKGACHGDSGGPLYVHLTDGMKDYGFRVAGSTSGPGSLYCDCSCSTTYVNIDNHVRQIEALEGIDVTPCTDSAGNWAPTPACASLLKDPATSSGAFPTCSAALTSDRIETCGPNPYGGLGGSSGSGAGGSGGVLLGQKCSVARVTPAPGLSAGAWLAVLAGLLRLRRRRA